MSAATTAEIATWILPAFAGVTLDDALPVDSRGRRRAAQYVGLGTDDLPHLSLTERTYTPDQERVYGEWGCERAVVWEIGKRGEPLHANRTSMRAAEFVAAFVRRNGRVRLSIRGTFLNGQHMREMIVGSIAPCGSTDLVVS